jgi:hypothetical protein
MRRGAYSPKEWITALFEYFFLDNFCSFFFATSRARAFLFLDKFCSFFFFATCSEIGEAVESREAEEIGSGVTGAPNEWETRDVRPKEWESVHSTPSGGSA